MTTTKRGKFYHYEFEFRKKQYRGFTHQKTQVVPGTWYLVPGTWYLVPGGGQRSEAG